ncbi:hypothetical protein GQ457_02G020200 [Hibiscus cannabinus]
MALVAWNARGVGNSNTHRALRDTLKKFNPCIVFLSETKKKQKYLERLRTKNRFSGSFYVDPRGLAGGLALWWTEDISVTILKDSVNFIDTLVAVKGEEPCQCTFIYGPPNSTEKQQFWRDFHQIRRETTNKWCVIGDVNIVADQSEKEGGNPVSISQTKCFLDFLDVSGMIELPIKGGRYTWTNMRSNSGSIAERLDKVIMSNEWSMAFPKAIGILEAAVASDHNPIVVLLEGLKRRRKRDFKFETRWLLEEECSTNVKEAWAENTGGQCQSNLNRRLRNTRIKLQKWSGMKYGNSRRTVEEIKRQLLDLQKLPLTHQIKEEIYALKQELQKLWESEERHWHQRARVNWIKYGDRNTKFFHATTIQRYRQNAIVKIKDEADNWVEEEQKIFSIFQNHFRKLYCKEEAIDVQSLSDVVPVLITEAVNSSLSKEVTVEEIKKAAFDMGPLKSPGPDGFSGIFYQTFWETISTEVIALVSDFFCSGTLDESISKTNIVLIPKTKNPTEVNQFRPISLCNFSLKIITKILATRLKAFLPKIIPDYQSAFVNGRLIQDNIILAHEAFHAMKKKRKGAEGIMALKIDLEKAYDKNNVSLMPASSSSDLSNDKAFWASIWSLNAPPKIKSFVWKACHNIIPSNGNLSIRFHGNFRGGSSCPRCGENCESVEHLLFFCPFAKTVWKCSGFGYEPETRGFPGFGQWWKKLSTLNKKGLFGEGLNLLSFLCWHLWKSRNALVFEASIDSPIDVWNRALNAFEEYVSSQNNDLSSHVSSSTSALTTLPPSNWTPPPPGFLKINCDAAFEVHSGRAVAACVVRDEYGRIIKGETLSFLSRSASIAEAIAVRKGVLLAINEGWIKVIFESDNKGVITRLNSGMFNAWESKAVEMDISSLKESNPFFSFCFVKRNCNKAADWVARATIKGVCPLNWSSCPPLSLRNLL